MSTNNKLTEAALNYRDNHHWVPLRLRGKTPDMGKGWQKRTLADAIPEFEQGDNIGFLLGAPSADVVRLDPDFQAIDAVTDILFPEPTAVSGRKSSPRSGRFYICSGIKTENFKLPNSMKEDPRLPLHDGKRNVTVFQILSTGAQTVAPPSIHPESGEEIVWVNETEPKAMDQGELIRRVGIEAFCMAVRQFWPARGARNEAAMALARVLLEALATVADEEERIAVVDDLVLAVAMAGGDGEDSRDGKERAAATLEKMRAGEETIGLSRLVELLELPNGVMKNFRQWLGLSAQTGISIQMGSAADPNIAKLNESYALVIVGDKIAILKETTKGIKLMTVSTFETWYSNQFVAHNERKVPLAKYWMSHPARRQYEGIEFAPNSDVPNHYNLWRGFAVEPRPGDCSKILAHLKDNVCRGDEDHYKWVVGWFAQIVQYPDKKMGTSLVIRGKQGSGKTMVGWVFGKIFGDHYARVADPRYVTGRFNSHLTSCLLLHCDEAFWAGDHEAEGKLKDLITSERASFREAGVKEAGSETAGRRTGTG